jgi:hypothetical protein
MLLGGAVLLVRDQLPAQTVFILSNLCFEASLFSSWLGMLHFHHLQRRHRHWKGLIGSSGWAAPCCSPFTLR